jgi:integrase
MAYLIKHGARFYLRYWQHGRRIEESTGLLSERDAKKRLAARVAQIDKGERVEPGRDRLRYEQLRQNMLDDYQTTERRDLGEVQGRLRHLDPFFAHMKAVAITPTRITAYAKDRKAAGASNGTINRELALLRHAMRLAVRQGLLSTVPAFTLLKEAAPRAGFFEADAFAAVCRHLPEDLQLALQVEYTYGWRMQSEVLTRQWPHLDFAAGTLRLDAGEAKNDDPRVVYLDPELVEAFRAQRARVEALQRALARVIPHVFPHLDGPHRGTRRRDFRRAWKTACRRAGQPGMLRHDLRRTAVRNLVNTRTPEVVAMKITGHKTRTVFDRYHIVS